MATDKNGVEIEPGKRIRSIDGTEGTVLDTYQDGDVIGVAIQLPDGGRATALPEACEILAD